MRVFSNPKMILATFLSLKIAHTVYAFLTVVTPVLLPYLRLAEVIVLIPHAYLAAKGRTSALCIVGMILLFQIFSIFWAIFLVSFNLDILETVAVSMSGYFVFGGCVLFRQVWDNLAEA